LEVPAMNVSAALNFFSRRNLVSGVAGLILMVATILPAIPTAAIAGDPYDSPDDAAAYQAYTAQYGRPMPPPPQYFERPDYAPRGQLEAQLNYAEAQYDRARQAGDRAAAKHWKKDIKHLRRELYGEGRAEGPGYGAPAYMPPQGPSYGPPASAYAPPTREYAPPGPAYAQPYPSMMPPYGYAGAPPAPYPPAGYPPSGYPNGAGASIYGAPGATGSMGGLSSLLGPLLGTGAAPPAAPYPPAGYPQAGYPGAAAGSPYGVPATTGSMGGLSSLLGPLLGGRSTP
jgi:hypothetical protein